MSINLKTLIGKLNETTRAAATRAANICMGMGHAEVDVEHIFLALLGQQDCDLCTAARKCSISLTALEADLRKELATFRTGNERVPVFSQRVQTLFEHAWLIASLGLPQPDQIRSLHLLLALLTEPGLAQYASRSSPLFGQFPVDELKHKPQKYLRGSAESVTAAPEHERDHGGDPAGQLLRPTPSLDQYTTNLTQQARDGKLDPVIGREAEIRQTVDILMRRRQNNPILTGEAGVGKTAVAEGLALRIAANDVPPALQNVAIHALDMGLLQAGASVKGEFESRLKNVIEEVKRSPHPVVLFIDEAHALIGAGGPAGQGDAANLLKPALARGELRTIAATTWSEYKKYFEKDAALARRFQVVKVEEPDEATASSMLRAITPLMESHFGVRVRDDAVTEAVRLSHRFMAGRQLPDKAVSVLDTACARVALAQTAAPAMLEDAACQIERLSMQIEALERDIAEGAVPAPPPPPPPPPHGRASAQRVAGPAARLAVLRDERGSLQAWHGEMSGRWQREKSLCEQIVAARASGGAAPVASLMRELETLQAGSPMVPLEVDGGAVASVVAAWTGVPLGKMVRDEVRTVQQLRPALEARVLGQSHATDAVARRMRIARANLEDAGKPKGVFLFTGPSGVGKTETALALADLLFGGERKLITVNMSEYQEAHSISGLKGSPPGYIGFGEGGVLTEAVRRCPYSVVLLDEMDKAHPDVIELFYQVFDKGFMEDAEGRAVDFRNTVIIMTCNLGSSAIMQACFNQPARPSAQAMDALVRPLLVRQFKPAFLGRVEVVPFYPIADDVLAQIIALKLGQIAQRVSDNHHAEFSWDEPLLEAVLARCTEVDSGARNVDAILNGLLLPEIADAVLARVAEGTPVSKVRATARQGQFKLTIK